MDLFLSTFKSVAVLMVIGLVGFYVISRRILPGKALDLLHPLGLEIALPCLIFVNIVRKFNPMDAADWWAWPLWWGGFTLFSALLTLLGMALSAKPSRREFGLSLFYQNAIFFPVGIIAQIYGKDSSHLADLFLFTMFFSAFVFNTYWLFLRGDRRGADWSKIFHPAFVATVLALGIRLAGLQVYLPEFALTGLSMVGQMAVPLLMLILGGTIYLDFKEKGRLEPVEVGKFVLLKNILFPLVALVGLIILRPSYNVALIIFLQSAVPPITSVPILVSRQRGNRSIACQFLVGSFLFSLISIPIMAMIFSHYFPGK
jgi:predicted permease